MKPLGAFAQFAALMLEGDYSPVPIKVGEKRPLFEKWDRLRSAALTPAEIEELCRNYPGLGLEVAAALAAWCRSTLTLTTGILSAPFAVPFRLWKSQSAGRKASPLSTGIPLA